MVGGGGGGGMVGGGGGGGRVGGAISPFKEEKKITIFHIGKG